MNLKVITYTRTRNYGGILQAYGLYNYLSSCGHNVSFIDYVPERCNVEDEKVFTECTIGKSRFWGRNAMTKLVWRKLEYPCLLKAYQPFRAFLDDRCSFTRRYTSCDELMATPPEADCFITGSDQVWNSSFTCNGKVDRPFYLPFAKGKKISYASSFGMPRIPPENVQEVRSLLSRYEHLSVRERSGLQVLDSLGLRGDVVCDPTILCDKGVWDSLASCDVKCDYVMLYQVRFNRGTFDLARRMAKARGKKLVVATMNPRDRHNVRGCDLLLPTVEQWLGLIKGAESIVTDSFHACVFSTLFNRPFLVNSRARKQMSSRITDFLEMTSIEGREIVGGDIGTALKQLDEEIDWDETSERLAKKRLESQAWLSSALGE